MKKLLSGRALLLAWCSWTVIIATVLWRVFFVRGMLVGMPRRNGVPVDPGLVVLALLLVACSPVLLFTLTWFLLRRSQGRGMRAAL